MKKISKPLSTEHAVYYEQYINKVDEQVSILTQLKNNAKWMEETLLNLSEEKLNTPYAVGKWSLKDLLQHIIDCERIFVYRALRFSRNDKTATPFFEEDDYAKEANANRLPIKKLLKEYKTTRAATLTFFNNLDTKTLKRSGIAGSFPTTVRACAWIACGHELHHISIMKERYL